MMTSTAPTALIAEDEPVLLAELEETLGRLWPELKIVARARDGVEALQLIAEQSPTILFLDIVMPGMTGLEVARHVSRSHVVFVTAYDHYAVSAFERGALDYVLKPINTGRLADTLQRIRGRLSQPPANLSSILAELAHNGGAHNYLRWINASAGNTIRLITVDEVAYFRADNKYTIVATRSAESLIRKSIRELIEQLDPNQFWQIHRSTVVNVAAIAGVTREFGGRLNVKLKDRDEVLTVSETFAHLFRQM
jgi:DNA-binding LytR/AlgR family response regulator